MCRWRRLRDLSVIAILGSCGCGEPPHVDPAPETDASVRVGRVEHTFLGSGSDAESLLPENQEYKPPRILEAPAPVYPERALAANAAPQAIVVKILVGTDGDVEDVLDSPRQPPESGPFEAEFRHAVEEALRQWTFTPAAICTYDPGADLNGDGTPDYRIERSRVPLRVLYDVRFRFEIVDGEGTVRQEGGTPR